MPHQPHVFITILDLRPQSRPGFVVRDHGQALVALDWRATCNEAVTISVDGLTTEEMNNLRESFGEPPVPQPISEFWLTDCRIDLELLPDEILVPSDLRAKGEQRELMLGA